MTHRRLHQIIRSNKKAIRAGATKDHEQRKGQYEREGYSGTMYYANTDNMKSAEDKLFKIKVPPENVQTRSNISEEPGYVYVIVGTKVVTTSGGWETWCVIL